MPDSGTLLMFKEDEMSYHRAIVRESICRRCLERKITSHITCGTSQIRHFRRICNFAIHDTVFLFLRLSHPYLSPSTFVVARSLKLPRSPSCRTQSLMAEHSRIAQILSADAKTLSLHVAHVVHGPLQAWTS